MVPLEASLVERTLTRLGIERPACDRDGLARLYAAWGENVAFDNVQKRVWLAERRGPMPGDDPWVFFRDFLTHGTGGTCWASSSALHALLRALGFDAQRAAGAMMLGGGPPTEDRRGTHGTVLCRVDGEMFLVDTHVLTTLPLPYRTNESTAIDGVGWARLEPDEPAGGMRLHFENYGRTTGVSCLLHSERVDDTFCTERHLRSETQSGFNEKTFLRRRRGPRGLVVVSGTTHREVQPGGVQESEFADRVERDQLLCALGLSEEIVARLPPDPPAA
jgi:N-hydroxyarylamine O-acetyltransferase